MAKATETVVKNEKDDLVPVYLRPKYKGDDTQFVSINGRRWLIRKGETVMVPKDVAELLNNAAKQEIASDRYINGLNLLQ